MKCNEIQYKLLSFIDLELPLQDMGEIKTHIQSCTHCSRVASQLGTLPNFSPLFESEKDEAFWLEFDSTLYKKLELKKKESKVVKLFNDKKFQKLAIAASLVVFLLATTLFFNTNNKVDDIYLPNPKDQGVAFSLSPVGLSADTLEFAPNNGEVKTNRLNHAPILENVDYRRDVQNGFY